MPGRPGGIGGIEGEKGKESTNISDLVENTKELLARSPHYSGMDCERKTSYEWSGLFPTPPRDVKESELVLRHDSMIECTRIRPPMVKCQYEHDTISAAITTTATRLLYDIPSNPFLCLSKVSAYECPEILKGRK